MDEKWVRITAANYPQVEWRVPLQSLEFAIQYLDGLFRTVFQVELVEG